MISNLGGERCSNLTRVNCEERGDQTLLISNLAIVQFKRMLLHRIENLGFRLGRWALMLIGSQALCGFLFSGYNLGNKLTL